MVSKKLLKQEIKAREKNLDLSSRLIIYGLAIIIALLYFMSWELFFIIIILQLYKFLIYEEYVDYILESFSIHKLKIEYQKIKKNDNSDYYPKNDNLDYYPKNESNDSL